MATNIEQMCREVLSAKVTGWQGEVSLERFAQLNKHIQRVDADEAQDKADAAYQLMWSTSEQLAETVKELRSLGHKDLREMRVLAILNDAILALEAEGFGS